MKITIPETVAFSDLQLGRHPSGDVEFDWTPVEAICAASGIDVAEFRDAPEDAVGALLMQWYAAHRAAGGDPDPVAEDLIAEVEAEDRLGSGVSLPPGRA